MHLLSLHRVAL